MKILAGNAALRGRIPRGDGTVLLNQTPTEEYPRQTPWHIAENTRKCDTISAVLALRAEGVQGEIIALNFANAMVPGGGYILGGDAQEESLCRSALLFREIAPCAAYYLRHWFLPSPLYTDAMLYSQNVPVVRDAAGELLPEPVPCSFVTCAAVNRKIARLFFIPEKKINAIMERRIDKIMYTISQPEPEAVVLGAFGCGAFGNRREDIFPMIESAVSRFLPDSVRVIFAMP